MNVLFLTKYELARYGVAQTLQALSESLLPLGIRVLVCSSHDSARGGTMPNGRPCTWAALPKPGLLRGRPQVRALAAICREHAIGLVHAHGLYRPGWAALHLKRRTALPYVVTSHGDIMPTSSRQQRQSVRRRCKAILAGADAVISLTEAMAGYAEDLCDVSDKNSVIPNGIFLDRWRQIGDVPADRFILAAGTLTPQKGFSVLIDALKQLIDAGQDVSLVLAGEGPQAEALRAQARGAGLSVQEGLSSPGPQRSRSVIFAGYVDGAGKHDLFRRAALVAFPSQKGEGFGLVLIEAMAARKAIVASDSAGTRSIVEDGVNGLLVDPPDADAWAAAIRKLLQDNELRENIERQNFQQAEQYDWPVIAGKLAEIYRRVLPGAADNQQHEGA